MLGIQLAQILKGLLCAELVSEIATHFAVRTTDVTVISISDFIEIFTGEERKVLDSKFQTPRLTTITVMIYFIGQLFWKSHLTLLLQGLDVHFHVDFLVKLLHLSFQILQLFCLLPFLAGNALQFWDLLGIHVTLGFMSFNQLRYACHSHKGVTGCKLLAHQ